MITKEIPTAVKALAIIHTFVGLGWIIVSYFGIWKMKKWGLYAAVLCSVLWIIGFLLGSVDAIIKGQFTTIGIFAMFLIYPIIAFYVMMEHEKKFT